MQRYALCINHRILTYTVVKTKFIPVVVGALNIKSLGVRETLNHPSLQSFDTGSAEH